MENEIDRYISRSLKNWAASQQASPPSREEVQKAAAVSPSPWQEPVYFRTSTVVHEFASNRMVGYYTGDWLRGPFSVSLGWPTQLSALVQISG